MERGTVLHSRGKVPPGHDQPGLGRAIRSTGQPVREEKEQDRSNYYRFELSPNVTIALGAHVKKPGESMTGEHAELVLDESSVDYGAEHARLLTDAMHGNQILFARQDLVEEQWRIVDGILDNVTPVHEYQTGTWGPRR